ncbi:hypothetical protein [Sulfurisphaera ohwakuensis]|uniref:Uncharacterized protein n=1 Tax=Sulfurisphaera ohwakuensis TaxID=69656 RepID=A0A650CJM0_SULOH|nr:hypothetical protein [Sulfurisphaera ohwakuensis]MBB5254640.1 hypothetical protein [Sulfurisphaera ohwakuensis]QGR18030.1 hypothetical protein D1869_13165 [Sulfurisphaera ohwakuensis]
MKRIITLSLEDLSEAKDKVRKVLKKLQYEDEVIVISKSDISYLFRGYNVEKEKDEEGLWIIRIKKN